jgi:hypothetical protein
MTDQPSTGDAQETLSIAKPKLFDGKKVLRTDRDVVPGFYKARFRCPTCETVAAQKWIKIFADNIGVWGVKTRFLPVDDAHLSKCEACDSIAIWIEKKLAFPSVSLSVPPVPDLSGDARSFYDEAAAIADRSPRAAAALLRACVESILTEVTGKKNLDKAIAALEADDMPSEIIDMMDVVRLNGNGALHAAALYGDDDATTVSRLFTLVEAIVERTITRRRVLEEMRKKLPPEKLKAIEERRSKAQAQGSDAS